MTKAILEKKAALKQGRKLIPWEEIQEKRKTLAPKEKIIPWKKILGITLIIGPSLSLIFLIIATIMFAKHLTITTLLEIASVMLLTTALFLLGICLFFKKS